MTILGGGAGQQNDNTVDESFPSHKQEDGPGPVIKTEEDEQIYQVQNGHAIRNESASMAKTEPDSGRLFNMPEINGVHVKKEQIEHKDSYQKNADTDTRKGMRLDGATQEGNVPDFLKPNWRLVPHDLQSRAIRQYTSSSTPQTRTGSISGYEPDVNLQSMPPLLSPQPIRPQSPSMPDPFILPLQLKSESRSRPRNLTIETGKANVQSGIVSPVTRPGAGSRTSSTPAHIRSPELPSVVESKATLKTKSLSRSDQLKPRTPSVTNSAVPSPMPPNIPLPPLSLPTYLQLELSSHRPSQSYIYRSTNADFPYESSQAKIERLLNFLFLPHQLEAVLWFGTLACLDHWLYTFTILPLRLLKSFYILSKSWSWNFISELRFVARFVLKGSLRMWQRRRTRGDSIVRQPLSRANSDSKYIEERLMQTKSRSMRHHRRAKSVPSTLLPDDKADILKGLLIIFTCLILLRLDASRMYHWVRGQAAIKLYVIYNVLEVCDRLLSAIGQDVLECLFSQEALERKPNGHSKVLRPFWLFILALTYTVIHSTALFYQVVTLNVAVNSYSNALITLLMSNQFVEIKGTVFKKFEKENLFQLTCADVVERFQLWHMLMIIAMRNVVETEAWNMGLHSLTQPSATASASKLATNASQAIPPLSVSSILPRSFTFLPSVVSSLSSYIPTVSQILSPFVVVLGSEMLIDWLKHAYINKFNNVRPSIYGQFLDVLAKDYYSNAFGDQNLTKRLGLPVIPLSCLMIRATVQTYRMLIAVLVPSPPPSAAASLASIQQQFSASRNAVPTSTAGAIVAKVDDLLYHIPSSIANSKFPSYFTTFLMLLLAYLVLLTFKLVLGMLLLAYSRTRYRAMKERERGRDKTGNNITNSIASAGTASGNTSNNTNSTGTSNSNNITTSHYVEGACRVGGWGVVEVDDDKRQRIYEDDPAGMRSIREKEAKDNAKREQAKDRGSGVEALDKVKRYEMVAKRIW